MVCHASVIITYHLSYPWHTICHIHDIPSVKTSHIPQDHFLNAEADNIGPLVQETRSFRFIFHILGSQSIEVNKTLPSLKKHMSFSCYLHIPNMFLHLAMPVARTTKISTCSALPSKYFRIANYNQKANNITRFLYSVILGLYHAHIPCSIRSIHYCKTRNVGGYYIWWFWKYHNLAKI